MNAKESRSLKNKLESLIKDNKIYEDLDIGIGSILVLKNINASPMILGFLFKKNI